MDETVHTIKTLPAISLQDDSNGFVLNESLSMKDSGEGVKVKIYY